MSAPRVATVENDGLTFDVRDEGPLDGPVVVLLHGFPQRASCWDRVAPLLHDRGLRTLAPDQRGYSPRARPEGASAYRMRRLVGDVAALVDRVGGPVHLVGHDWGAAVAWATAATRPDLVSTLTTVSVPHPAAMMRSLKTLDQVRRSWYMALFQLPWLPERLLSGRLGRRWLRHTGMTTAMLDRYADQVVADGALPGGLAWYRAMRGTDPRLVARRVRVPTLHVWSDRDVALGRRGAELTAEYVDAAYRLEVLGGVSHWVPEQAPGRLAALVADRIGVPPE